MRIYQEKQHRPKNNSIPNFQKKEQDRFIDNRFKKFDQQRSQTHNQLKHHANFSQKNIQKKNKYSTSFPSVTTMNKNPIQRTKWVWESGSWSIYKQNDSDKDVHDEPDKKNFKDLEDGDTYDQTTGELERRNERAIRLRGRMNRASKRQKSRKKFTKRGQQYTDTDFKEIKKANNNRIPFNTPAGKMSFGRGMFTTQPFGTFAPEHWKGTDHVKHNYDALSKIIDNSEHGKDIIDEMQDFMGSNKKAKKSKFAKTDKEKKAVTGISALLPVAESHKTRNPTGGKVERSSLRYGKKHNMKKTFNRKNGAYVPAHATAGGAKKGGTGAFREMREGTRDIPINTLEMLSYMSASSSDESSSDELSPVPKRRSKKKKKTTKKKKNRSRSRSNEKKNKSSVSKTKKRRRTTKNARKSRSTTKRSTAKRKRNSRDDI